MNIGALIVLFKLLQDSGVAVSPNGPPGPPAPNGEEVVQTGEVKPMCPPGHYASQDTFGNWTCVPIPKGR